VTTTRTEKIRGTIHRYMPDRRSQWRWLYPLQRICEKAARAMVTGVDRLLGWFPHNHREWIEFIIGPAAVAADGGGHIGARLEFDHSNLANNLFASRPRQRRRQ
jgi:hypothetical protein